MAFSPETALKYLQRAHEQNRLAHAYLITGATGSGKEALALSLAELVNKTSSPNGSGIFKVNPESKSRRIVIEQIRELEHSLQMRATNGLRKIAIVSAADRLQPQAANAFLKTLEEPPKDSLLLLLSALPELLPDTIRSRCIAIPLASKQSTDATEEERELIELLQQIAREKQGVQSAYRLAQGLQGLLRKIREEIQDENAAAQKRDETRYKNTTDGAWLDEREDYYKALNESLYLQRRARLLETFFCGGPTCCARAPGSIVAICRLRERKPSRGRSNSRPRRFFAACAGSKNCAIILAATFRKRSHLKSPSCASSLVRPFFYFSKTQLPP